jgi:hypothetical protein
VDSPCRARLARLRDCHAAIEADDREALLDSASLIPVPRTVPERFAPKFLERARRLHVEFWESRSGPARPAWPSPSDVRPGDRLRAYLAPAC